ncbi:YHS domain-containing protein [Thermophagus xiamenensis]|nr:YHS domain-containing protein [Thermophagus xiamenensis]
MRKLIFKALTVLLLALLTSSCMTMGLGHVNTNQQVSGRVRYTDPVCGNSIRQASENISYKYDDSVYYFHTQDCLDEFKQAPEKYIANSNMNHHNNNAMIWGLGGAAMVGMMWLMFL